MSATDQSLPEVITSFYFMFNSDAGVRDLARTLEFAAQKDKGIPFDYTRVMMHELTHSNMRLFLDEHFSSEFGEDLTRNEVLQHMTTGRPFLRRALTQAPAKLLLVTDGVLHLSMSDEQALKGYFDALDADTTYQAILKARREAHAKASEVARNFVACRLRSQREDHPPEEKRPKISGVSEWKRNAMIQGEGSNIAGGQVGTVGTDGCESLAESTAVATGTSVGEYLDVDVYRTGRQRRGRRIRQQKYSQQSGLIGKDLANIRERAFQTFAYGEENLRTPLALKVRQLLGTNPFEQENPYQVWDDYVCQLANWQQVKRQAKATAQESDDSKSCAQMHSG